MNATTQDVAGVGTAVPLETAQELCAKVSGMRVARRSAAYVGGAMNGAASASSNPRAVSVRKEHQREGGYQPTEGLLTMDDEDRADGVPLALVLEPRLLEIEWLRMRAGTPCDHRPVAAAFARETKAQARFDLTQLRVIEQPADPAAIREAIAAANHNVAMLDEALATLRRMLIAANASQPTRRFVGRRPARPLAMVQS